MHDTFKRLMEAAGDVSQADLARRIGESEQTLTNWKTRGVPRSKSIQLASILGVTPTWLETGRTESVEPQIKRATGADQIDAEAEARSRKAVADFKKHQPCPVTGKPRGACPGWQVDHRIPLKCGGPDDQSNMQWLTVQDHKRKTAREARWCRR